MEGRKNWLTLVKKKMKKAHSATRCSLTVVRRSPKISPRADPISEGTGRQKFNQLEMATTFIYRETQLGEARCTQFRAMVVTDPPPPTHTHTNKQTHRQDRLQYTAPLSLARSVTIQTLMWRLLEYIEILLEDFLPSAVIADVSPWNPAVLLTKLRSVGGP